MSRWDGIDEFVAVASLRSFARAAQQLGLSRTHMSRAIAGLEDRVQARLLNRTTRVVNPTPAGEVFLEHCKRILAERDEALALVSDKGEPSGELAITCSTALGERFVAPLVRSFALRHPRLRINLDLSNRVIDVVAEGFDLAVRTGHLAASSLVATRIAERRLFTCAAPAYLERHGTPRTIEDLAQHDCLAGTAASWHFSRNGREQLFRPRGRWRCNNGQVILAAAEDGMGVCQLPDFYVGESLRAGRLVAILTEAAPLAEPIWAVYPSRRHLTPKVSLLIDHLRAGLPQVLRT